MLHIFEAFKKQDLKKLLPHKEKYDRSNFCLLVPYNKAHNYVKELYGDVEIFAKRSNPNAFIIPIEIAKEIESKYNDNAVLYEIPHIYKSIDDFEEAYAAGDIILDMMTTIKEEQTEKRSLRSYILNESRSLVNSFIKDFKNKVEKLYKKYKLDGEFRADWDRLTAFVDDAKFNAGNSIHLGGGLYFKGDFKNAEKINQEIKKLSSSIAKTILNFLKFNIVVTYNWAVSDVKDTGEYRILLSGDYNMCAFDLNKDNMDEVLSKIEELLKVVKKYKK